MSGEAPEGWVATNIGSLFAMSTPGHWGEEGADGGNILVLRSANFLKSGGLNYETAALRKFDAKKLVQKRLKSGDILLERSGGSPAQPVGRVNRFDAEGDFSASNFLQILRARDEVDEWFAYFLLDSFYARGGTENLQKATTGIRNLDFATYLASPILLPPLDEQRRIAEVLRSLDEVTAGNRAVLVKAAETLALLSDELLVANAQRIGEPVKFGDLLETLEAGVSVNSEGRPAQPDEIGILKTSCVSAGYFEPAEHKAVLESERARVRVPVRGDSIIISRMNTFELVGANAFVDADYADLYLPDRLWLLKANSRVRVRWLAFYMKTAKFREQVISIATGTSGSMKNISKARLNDLVVFIPSDQQQAQDIAALSAVETVLLTARKIDDRQQVAAVALKSDLLSGSVRVPA